MSRIIPFSPKVVNLDSRWAVPGVIGVMGINQGQDRLNMGDYGCWYVENWEPSFKGWNNVNLGVVKRGIAPQTAKVQGIIGLGNCLFYVVNGSLYCMNLNTYIVTMPINGANIFNTSAKVRMAINQGKSGTACTKIYMCDGFSVPKVYSSATNSVSNVILAGYSNPVFVSTWQRRIGWTFNQNTSDENRILFSAEEDGDDYNTSGSAQLDAFDDYVWNGDGDHIVGFGSVQFKGQDAQSDALIVCKSQRSFIATEVNLSGGVRAMTFNNNGVDIGAVSPDALIQFGNDLWILTKTGIKGFNTVLEGSGGISAFSSSPVSGINRLIEKSSQNTAFNKSFVVHHTTKKKIRIFMPRDSTTSAVQNGFNYNEIPIDYALNYGYDVLPQWEGNTRGEALWARGGAGFAFFCGCEYQERLFLGDYFGNIYEMDCDDAGDDYIPSSGNDQIITSIFSTPFMKLTGDANFYDSKKRLLELILHVRTEGVAEYQIQPIFVIDKEPYEKILPTIVKNIGTENSNVSIYGSSLYGQSIYGSLEGNPTKIIFKAPGYFNAIGLNNIAKSKIVLNNGIIKSNRIFVYAVTGRIES